MPNEALSHVKTLQELITTVFQPNEPFYLDTLLNSSYQCASTCNLTKKTVSNSLNKFVRDGFLLQDKEHQMFLYTNDEEVKAQFEKMGSFYQFSQANSAKVLTFLKEKYNFKKTTNDFLFNIRDNEYILLATPKTAELLRSRNTIKELNEEPFYVNSQKISWRLYEHKEMTPTSWSSILFIEMLTIYYNIYGETPASLPFSFLHSDIGRVCKRNPLFANAFYVLFSDVIGKTGRVRHPNGSKIYASEIYDYLNDVNTFCHTKLYYLMEKKNEFVGWFLAHGGDADHYTYDLYNLFATLSHYDAGVSNIVSKLLLQLVFPEANDMKILHDKDNHLIRMMAPSDFYIMLGAKHTYDRELSPDRLMKDTLPWVFLRYKKSVSPQRTNQVKSV